MAMEKSPAEDATSSSSASNNQLPPAESLQSTENLMCPICLDVINDRVSVSWCSHAFCFPCILEWSSHKAVCPICREPFQYLLRQVGDNNYEVYSIGPHTSSVRLNRRRRAHHHSSERRRHHSTGHRRHRSSRRVHSSGHARDRERDQRRSRERDQRRSRERNRSRSRERNRSRSRERDRSTSWERERSRSQSRSRRWNHDSHSRGQEAQDYDPSSSRRQQNIWVSETSSEESQAARHERDVPDRLGGSEHRQQAQWVYFRASRATRSQSWQPQQASRSHERHRDR